MTEEEEQQALDRVMAVFWAAGATEATYGDLVQATGLSRKALYARWPDKAHLLQAALEAYADRVLSARMAPLSQGARGLAQFWTELEAASTQPGFRGCFLVTTATGPLGGDGMIAAAFAAHLDRLEAQLHAAIALGIAEGALAPVQPPQAAALAVALAVQIQVLMSSGRHAARLPGLFALARQTCGLSG